MWTSQHQKKKKRVKLNSVLCVIDPRYTAVVKMDSWFLSKAFGFWSVMMTQLFPNGASALTYCMVPDLQINSLISGLIDGYTSLWLFILSSLKAAQCSFMFCSSFPVPLFLSFLFPLSLHSSLSKTLVSGFLFFLFFP